MNQLLSCATVKRLSKWKLRVDEIRRLKRLVNSGCDCLEFLGFTVDLGSGEVYDQLKKDTLCNERDIEVLHVLLAHYSRAERTERTGRLVKFQDLPGGHAYEKAFVQRVIQPIAKTFGDEPEALVEAAKLLNGVALVYGDSSVEIPALTGIPIVYILWRADEFPASATTLFDESASHYLPTEDLAVLAELTTIRLEQSWAILRSRKAQF
jgi:hypothetical protein